MWLVILVVTSCVVLALHYPDAVVPMRGCTASSGGHGVDRSPSSYQRQEELGAPQSSLPLRCQPALTCVAWGDLLLGCGDVTG